MNPVGSNPEPQPAKRREPTAQPGPQAEPNEHLRDIAEVPAVEVITTVAIHLMTAAAVKCGLGDEPATTEPDSDDPDWHSGAPERDLDEARKLINALAGLVTAAAGDLGTFHAAPLKDGLRSLQLAFREASEIPDAPGQGPGEQLTGPVS